MMDEDELDPRIQVELEKLNSATDEINRLEIELDEANTTFRLLLNECTRRLKVHSSKHGSAIENARPYYEALEIARKAQQDCQQAAVNFQRANEVHEAAKETVALAESRFMSQQPEWRFDSAWQEMLNHATIKVRDAEKQRAESSTYHSLATARYKEAQEKVQLLEQRLRRNVAKSRPYFEEKQRCNEQLSAQKEIVETLATKVSRVKIEYAESLRRLEGISEEIHRKRGNVQTGVREPGVGAELVYKGEQEHCETSRESAFPGAADLTYDAKSNANRTSDKPSLPFGEESTTRTLDHVDESAADEFRQVIGDFQFRRSSSEKCPDVNTDTYDGREKTKMNVLRKVSFESLHGVHFNPVKDVPVSAKPMTRDSSVTSDNPSESTFMSEESDTLNSQGTLGLPSQQADGTQGISIDDNKSDISRGLENNSVKRSDSCEVGRSEDDLKSLCDQLTALKVHDRNEGAKGDNPESPSGVGEEAAMNVGGLSDGSEKGRVCGTGDNLKNNQTTVKTGWKRKSPVASECSNTSFDQQPDLELSFRDTERQQKNNDKDLLRANTHDAEVPEKQCSGQRE